MAYWNKYSQENRTQDSSDWTPPKRELEMEQVSRRLAVSSRIHPSYLLMAYDYLTEKRGIDPGDIKSISDLIYKAVCDYINVMREPEQGIPDPDIALDFLIEQGWISSSNKENQAAFTKIRHIKGQLEQKVMQGQASLKEQWEYWRDRDPQKAEEIMEKMTEVAIGDLNKPEDGNNKEQDYSSSKEEQELSNRNRSLNTDDRDGIASLDYLDDVPTADSKDSQ